MAKRNNTPPTTPEQRKEWAREAILRSSKASAFKPVLMAVLEKMDIKDYASLSVHMCDDMGLQDNIRYIWATNRARDHGKLKKLFQEAYKEVYAPGPKEVRLLYYGK